MDNKVKYYLGLYLFLKEENLLSMSLAFDFEKNLCKAFNVSSVELRNLLEDVERVINYDICNLYLHFNDE